jgi:hypothetical protein
VPLILVALLICVIVAFVAITLLSIALRYRAGTSPRQARPWVLKLNVWLTSVSMLFFLIFASLSSIWINGALRYALLGTGAGALLALLGLVLTRWETDTGKVFYTPSRWLALMITCAIVARLIYGWWRATHPTAVAVRTHWLLNASGTQLSVALAGALIGYYLLYGVGVLARFRRTVHREVVIRDW